MPSNCSQPAIWQFVADQSRLRILVSDISGSVVCAGRVIRRADDGSALDEDSLSDNVLRGGVTIPIDGAVNYEVRIAIEFPGAGGSATLHARMEKPDGTVHGSAYECPATGSGGAVRRFTLIAVTNAAVEVD